MSKETMMSIAELYGFSLNYIVYRFTEEIVRLFAEMCSEEIEENSEKKYRSVIQVICEREDGRT